MIGQKIQDYLSNNKQAKEKVDTNKFHHAIEMMCLSAFLVHERFEQGPKSFWFPYLDALPLNYTLAVCWTTEQRQSLLGTPLHFVTQERLVWLQKIYEIVQNACPTEFTSHWTFENLIWAFSSISSRAFPKARQEKDAQSDWITITELCLYPVLDMVLVIYLVEPCSSS